MFRRSTAAHSALACASFLSRACGNAIPDSRQVSTILLVGSGGGQLVSRATSHLQHLFPNATYHVITNVHGVAASMPAPRSARAYFAFLRQARAQQYDLAVIIVDGHRTSAKYWPLGLLSRARSYFVFNQNGDGCFLIRKNLRPVLRMFREGFFNTASYPWLREMGHWLSLPLGIAYIAYRSGYWRIRRWSNIGRGRMIDSVTLEESPIAVSEESSARGRQSVSRQLKF